MFTTIPTPKKIDQIRVNVPAGFVFRTEKPKERKPRVSLPKGELFDRALFAEPLIEVLKEYGGRVHGQDGINTVINKVRERVESQFKSADWETYESRGHKESRWRIGLKWVVYSLRKEGVIEPITNNRLCWQLAKAS